MANENRVSAPGRLVWGSVHEKQTTGYQGKPYEPGKEPIQFGLAVDKNHPMIGDMLGFIYQTAAAGYASNAHMVQRIQNEWQSGFAGLNFRFKIKDGDKPNQEGRLNENTKGCWVFTFSTTFDLKCCNWDNQPFDIKEIYPGCYIDVNFGCAVNTLTDSQAGVFLNPNVVRLLGFGERIASGLSIEDAFGMAPAPQIAGASRTPVASSPAMPGMGANPLPGATGAATPPTNTAPGLPAATNQAVPGSAGAAASPSNAPLPGMPAGGAVAGAPGGAPASTTAYPSDVQPNHGFVNGPGGMPLPGQG